MIRKLFLNLILMATFTLTGCSSTRSYVVHDVTSPISKGAVETSESNRIIEQNSGYVALNFDFSLVETLKEAPDWIGDAAEEYYYNNKFPDWIIDDYNKFVAETNLYKLQYCYHGNDILTVSSSDIDDVTDFKLFNKNGNLRYESFEPDLRELFWIEFNETGNRTIGTCNVDTLALDNVTIVGKTEDFTIVKRGDETECLYCVRFSKFIDTISISLPPSELVDHLFDAPYKDFGYVEYNSLMFPVLFNTENGMHFELCKIASMPGTASVNGCSTTTVDSIPYVFYAGIGYFIKNASEYIELDVRDPRSHQNTIYIAVVNDADIDIGTVTSHDLETMLNNN
jgi:hypothetical protein